MFVCLFVCLRESIEFCLGMMSDFQLLIKRREQRADGSTGERGRASPEPMVDRGARQRNTKEGTKGTLWATVFQPLTVVAGAGHGLWYSIHWTSVDPAYHL